MFLETLSSTLELILHPLWNQLSAQDLHHLENGLGARTALVYLLLKTRRFVFSGARGGYPLCVGFFLTYICMYTYIYSHSTHAFTLMLHSDFCFYWYSDPVLVLRAELHTAHLNSSYPDLDVSSLVHAFMLMCFLHLYSHLKL